MTGYQTPTRDEHDWMLNKARKVLEHHGWSGDPDRFDDSWNQVASSMQGGTVSDPIDGYRWRRWPELGGRPYSCATPTPSYEIRGPGIVLTWSRWIDPETDFWFVRGALDCHEITRQVRLTRAQIEKALTTAEQLELAVNQ